MLETTVRSVHVSKCLKLECIEEGTYLSNIKVLFLCQLKRLTLKLERLSNYITYYKITLVRAEIEKTLKHHC